MPDGFIRESYDSYILLGLLEKYVNGAIIQLDRIRSTRMDRFRLEEEFEEESKREHEEIDRCMKEMDNILKTEDLQQYSQLYEINMKMSAIREKYRTKFKEKMDQSTVNNRTLFLDVHFYFICCDKVQNLIEKLASKESNNELSALWSDLKPKFKPYNAVRNHLEHIEERLEPKYTGDMGNLWNDKFTFGGKEFDISDESLEFICGSYKQVLQVLGILIK